ncbi:MAG: hypothetical protein E7593_06200 [Ruminococcaceae bacterium]|nr:hypothetical protein [Oscillospiraceae bacterium]
MSYIRDIQKSQKKGLKFMKKTRILSLLLVFCLMLVSSTTAMAANTQDVQVSMKKIDVLKNSTLEISHSVDGFEYKETITNINLFKDSIKRAYPQIDNYELGKTILLSLGDTEEFIATLPREKVIEAVDYTSAIRTEVYLDESENGELTEVTREQYLQSKELVTLSDYDRDETFGDLVLKSTAYERSPSYALSGRSYFTIRGEVEWVGFPNFQMNDLLVISSSGNIDNNYSHYASGRWTHSLGTTINDTAYLYDEDGGDGKLISLSNPNIYGIGAEFPLGTGQQSQVLVDKVYCYYGVSCQKDISCQVSYAHAILAWNPSFSISSGGSVSFGGLGIQRQTFHANAFTLYH